MQVSVVPYHPRQRRAVSQFVRQHVRTHYHLDWHPVANWLRTDEGLSVLAFDEQGQLTGVLIIRSPIKGISWLRMAALHDNAASWVFQEMLEQLKPLAIERGVQQIAVLETEMWIRRFLHDQGFAEIDRIIHLKRLPSNSLPAIPPTIKIHQVQRRDLPQIEMIDQAAFAPYWQMRLDDLEEVTRQTSWFTAATIDEQIVGYQLSTTFSDVVHLARLATLPSYQRRGIGRALVAALIAKFPSRTVTVNTQSSNLASQRLYKKLDFRLQNWDTPVWRLDIGTAL